MRGRAAEGGRGSLTHYLELGLGNSAAAPQLKIEIAVAHLDLMKVTLTDSCDRSSLDHVSQADVQRP